MNTFLTARLQQGAVIGQRAGNVGKRKWTGHYGMKSVTALRMTASETLELVLSTGAVIRALGKRTFNV